MSGYTEISDPVDNNSSNNNAEENIVAPPVPQYEDPFAEDPVSKNSTTSKTSKTATNAVEFDDSLTLGFVTKIMTFVGVAITACGLIIALASGAAIPSNPDWLSTLGCIAPLFIMMLIALNRISHPLWFDIVVILLSMVAAFHSFFGFIAPINSPYIDGPHNGVIAGNFFVFLGETVVCVASFLAQYGF